MQQIQEAQIGHHLEENGRLPKEFLTFLLHSSLVPSFPNTGRSSATSTRVDVVLYGIPDEIFTLADGTQCVIDHKTAMNKGTGGIRFSQFTTRQTIGYARHCTRRAGPGQG